jgi:hypothetical protein
MQLKVNVQSGKMQADMDSNAIIENINLSQHACKQRFYHRKLHFWVVVANGPVNVSKTVILAPPLQVYGISSLTELLLVLVWYLHISIDRVA